MQDTSDICIYGGAAGGGKTFALLMLPLYHYDVKGFNSVLFRRTYPQIYGPEGPFQKSLRLYGAMGGKFNQQKHVWYVGKAQMHFGHIEHEMDSIKWQGSEICLELFDEVTEFTETQFWFMLSRNRSSCGVKPMVRATCNPDSRSWVRKFLSWYIGEDGYTIKERVGVPRYFLRRDDRLIWDDHKFDEHAKSLNFIEADLDDNQIFLQANPDYKANLENLLLPDKMRLLYKNWNEYAIDRLFTEPNYDRHFPNPKNQYIVAYLDPAFGGADYSALVIGFEFDGFFWILGGFIWQGTIDATYNLTEKFCERFQVAKLVVESNQAQRLIAFELRKRKLNVAEKVNVRNKHLRIQDSVKKNWDKIVFAQNIDKAFMRQLLDYSENAKNDDAPDALAGLIESLAKKSEFKYGVL